MSRGWLAMSSAHPKAISNRIINQQPFLLATVSNPRNRTTSYYKTFYTLHLEEFCGLLQGHVCFCFSPEETTRQSTCTNSRKHSLCTLTCEKTNYDQFSANHKRSSSVQTQCVLINSTIDSTDSCCELYSRTYLRCRVHWVHSTLKDSMIVDIPPIHVAIPTCVLKLISDQRWIRCGNRAKSCGDHAIVSIRSTTTKTTTAWRIHRPPKLALCMCAWLAFVHTA